MKKAVEGKLRQLKVGLKNSMFNSLEGYIHSLEGKYKCGSICENKLQALSGSDTQYCKSGDHIKTKKQITTNSTLSRISTILTKVTKENYNRTLKKNFFFWYLNVQRAS